jgi:hypothetical protein
MTVRVACCLTSSTDRFRKSAMLIDSQIRALNFISTLFSPLANPFG